MRRGNIQLEDEMSNFGFRKPDPEEMIHVEHVQTRLSKEISLFSWQDLTHYTIRFIKSGEGEVCIDHILYPLVKNRTMFVTPEQISWADIKRDTELDYYVIAFDQGLIDLMGSSKEITTLVTSPSAQLNKILDPKVVNVIVKYFELILEEFNRTERNDLVLAALIRALLIRFFTGDPKEANQKMVYVNIYRSFLEKLSEHYRSKHHVANYVEILTTNEKQLNRACKAITGSTAGKIIQQRLDFEAKRLLFFSTHTVRDISVQLGFKDPAHFSKFFKSKNKLTPLEYRLNQ